MRVTIPAEVHDTVREDDWVSVWLAGYTLGRDGGEPSSIRIARSLWPEAFDAGTTAAWKDRKHEH
jgi:hypothetical protein